MGMISPYHREIALDYEFFQPGGDRPLPLILSTYDLQTKEVKRYDMQLLWSMSPPPELCDPNTLYVTHFGSVEWMCHLALGFPLMPLSVDTYAEHSAMTNGLRRLGRNLVAIGNWAGTETGTVSQKKHYQALGVKGPPIIGEALDEFGDYCDHDAKTTGEAMIQIAKRPEFNLGQALFRGRYETTLGLMMFLGIPVDVALFNKLYSNWPEIQRLACKSHEHFGVFGREGDDMVFHRGRFKKMLADRDIPWVYKKKKARGGGYFDDLDYEVETFEAMAALYPELFGLVHLVKLFERIKLRPYAWDRMVV